MTDDSLLTHTLTLPPADRAAYLDRECPDPDQRARIEARLAATVDRTEPDSPTPTHELGGTDEYAPATQSASTTATRPPPAVGLAGQIIAGRYTLVEPVGEGGMGTVWRAKQSEPVKRFVAVKLIKAGMDSKAVLARFEAERQALALMDHPNIARIFDGGLHDNRPFFVMELVNGLPITEFCDERQLTPHQRLELFLPVCRAIQHAHQKGIIHRDIKPSNVLIALYDDRPVPKVIDFGVAKATGGALTEHTLDTGFGGVVGTPAYMSPEQATFNNLDIDTRTDVYALGVLLYELLVGLTPFTLAELRKAGLLEMLRVVREEEPPRPSAKLSTADALPSLAACRGTEPRKLTGLLRSELDWVVMKALEKDRTRRYDTANGFAADVQRYLDGEAVQAHPPSRRYRLKKFVRRNRPQVIAASLIVLALVTGIIGTTLGLVEARRQTELAQTETRAKDEALVAKTSALEAEAAAKLNAEDRRQQAEQNLAYATKGNEILGSVFKSLNPKANYATVAQFREVLKANLVKAVQELDGSAIGDPVTVADMQETLGASLMYLGEAEQAVSLLEKMLTTRKDKLSPDHPNTLTGMNNLAMAYRAAGRLDKVLSLLEETLRLTKSKLGPDHPTTLVSMANLALGYYDARKIDQAQPLAEETFERMKAKFGPDHTSTLSIMNNLASVYFDTGNYARAIPLYEETLRLRKAKLGFDHPDTLSTMGNLADTYRAAGKLDQALPLLEETLRLTKDKLGPDHPDTLFSMTYLADGYRAAGNIEKALLLLEETLTLRTAKLGPDHPDTLTSMNNLAVGYYAAGKLDQAVPLHEKTLTLKKIKFGADHPDTLQSMRNLAVAYLAAGKFGQALPLLEQTLQITATSVGPDHPDTLKSLVILGTAYCEAKQGAEAAPLLKKYIAAQRKRFPKDDPRLAGLIAQVSLDLLKCDEFAAAEPLLREALTIREKTQPDDWTTFNTMSLLGGALLGQKKYADAELLLVKGYEEMKAREQTIPPQGSTRIPEALDRLIELSTATKQPDDVKKYRELRAKYPTTPEVAPLPRPVK